MSFWGKLAGIVGDVAAPFTGGTSALIGNAVGGGLDMLGGAIGAADTADRNNMNAENQNRIRLAQIIEQGSRDNETGLINRSRFEAQQRGQDNRDFLRNGYLLQGGHPTNLPGGGITPAQADVLSPIEKTLAMRMMSPVKYGVDDLPAMDKFTPPTLQEPGKVNTAASWLAPTLGIGGKILQYLNQQKGSTVPGHGIEDDSYDSTYDG